MDCATKLDTIKVLIVEDEALVAIEIETILQSVGHQVVGRVDNLRDAVLLAAEQRPDIALVDIQLSQGDSGLDVAASLTSQGIACLFASGNCPRERGKGLALACLHKPFNDRALTAAVQVIRDLLRGQAPSSIPQAMHLY